MRLLDSDGRAFVGTLTDDQTRFLKALAALGSDQHIDGLILGIIEHTGKTEYDLLEIVKVLQDGDYICNSIESGKKLTTRGWNFIRRINQEIAKESRKLRKLR